MTLHFRFRASCLACAMLISLVCCRIAVAAQQYDVRDGDRIAVYISADALTRIAIVSGKIKEFWDDDETLVVEPDQLRGVLYVRPVYEDHKDPITFYVRDAVGRAYTLIATPKDIEAQSILLRPSGVQPASPQRVRAAALPHVTSIKRLVKAMARGVALSNYAITDTSEEAHLWEEVHLVRIRQYQGATLHGDTYDLTNATEKPLVIVESELVALPGTVLAVAIDSTDLAPGENTRVYVVRRGGQQ